jgi:hypothetical protein
MLNGLNLKAIMVLTDKEVVLPELSVIMDIFVSMSEYLEPETQVSIK